MVSKGFCMEWLKERTNLEKTLLSFSSLLFLAFLFTILGFALSGKKSDLPSDGDICWNNECIKIAGDVMSKMETTINSCTNLYDFACGKYGEEPGETVSVSRRSTESVYFSLKKIMESEEKFDVKGLDDVRSFYNSCVKFGSYRQDVKSTGEGLLQIMSDMGFGIWPIIDPLYDDSKFSLELTLASLVLLDVPVVYQMEVIPDEYEAGAYLMKISPGGPREKGRSPDKIRSDVHLSSSVLTSLMLLGASSAVNDARDVISVDSSFAKIEQNNQTACDDVIILSRQEAISELNRYIPEINWKITMDEIQKATGLLGPFAVQLHCKEKIRDYVVHLGDLSYRSTTSYLGWRFFSKFVEHVIPTFEKSQFGTDEVVSRWRVCLELMEKFASPILADVLSKKIINKEIEEEVRKISNSALVHTQRLVSRASWLSDSQRSRIREKVARIRVRYPFQTAADAGEVSQISVPQVAVRNFTSVVINRQKQWVIQKFRKLSQEVEFSESIDFSTSFLTARGDSASSDFTALVYFDKIRAPFIRLYGPKWMNYGAFGVSVAREISKLLMLMNTEASHEKNAAVWNVWSRSRNSSMCLVKSLAARLGITKGALPPDVTERLMKDIFLDQSAVEIAYETATSVELESRFLPGLELTNEKMFFLSYAQRVYFVVPYLRDREYLTLCEADSPSQESERIPAKDRLNTAVLNFETFNKVYGCGPASSQCQIWA